MSQCPSCNCELKNKTYYSEGVLYEEYESCPQGCYSYEYMMGRAFTTHTINGHRITFFWHYLDTPEEMAGLNLALKIVENIAKLVHLLGSVKNEDNQITT